MIEQVKLFAVEQNQKIDFRVDSCSELKSIADASIDSIVSNYALMDVPDLNGTVEAFYRVLRPKGKAVLVFSHPCFDELAKDEMYFDEIKKVDQWGVFDSDFIYFHRPLSQYWKAFKNVGFKIENFEEPVAKDPNIEGFKEEWRKSYRKRPWSVAFELIK